MHNNTNKQEYIKKVIDKIKDYSTEEEALLVGVATGLSLAKMPERDKKAS